MTATSASSGAERAFSRTRPGIGPRPNSWEAESCVQKVINGVRLGSHLNGKAAGSLPVATTMAADPDITLPIVAMQGFYQPSRASADA
jgi:hypothetical protein